MTTSDTQEAGKGMHAPWTVEIDAGVEQINDAAGNWVAETMGGKSHFIVTAVNSHSTLTEENARLLQENKAMREERAKVISVIPLNFLQAHDLPGATGITEHLDLVGAIRSLVNMGRKWEDRARTTLTQGERK